MCIFFLYRDEARSCLSIFVFVLKTLHSQSEWISLLGRVIRMDLLYRNAVSASEALSQAGLIHSKVENFSRNNTVNHLVTRNLREC